MNTPSRNMTAIFVISSVSLPLAKLIQQETADCVIYTLEEQEGCTAVSSFFSVMNDHFQEWKQVIFFGAMGICVRMISPCLKNKYVDPAVICIDSTGRFVIPVVSGHVGGANQMAEKIAHILGAEAIVTTQSDNEGLWALDAMAKTYGWKQDLHGGSFNQLIATFVNKKAVALLLEVKDKGTAYLERTLPAHVSCFYRYEDIPQEQFELLIAVTPRVYSPTIPALFYRPRVLSLGIGCRKQCKVDGIAEHIADYLSEIGLSKSSVAHICSIELKKDEPLLSSLASYFKADVRIFSADSLKDIKVPNPSEKAFEVTGVYGVAESCAIYSSGNPSLIIEKQKGCLQPGADFTFAVAEDHSAIREGHIEIIGAGPGDPELISVRGKEFLQQADLILYAGSLVPIELTYYAKPEAVVRSSASMNLEEQFELMKSFYDRGLLVARLHTGDPCIFGAIEEQMAYFDQYQMSYHITPGISSFQAAAAALRSQFTIPEKVQTIILTRGKGRTPMPEREELHKLAQSQSTMCIYLSASIVEDVQKELLQAYPPETPVAACYKLTWKDERIYRGQLKDLASIVRSNNLTLTTLLVVGDAIDNRLGVSRLYADEFKHLFRK